MATWSCNGASSWCYNTASLRHYSIASYKLQAHGAATLQALQARDAISTAARGGASDINRVATKATAHDVIGVGSSCRGGVAAHVVALRCYNLCCSNTAACVMTGCSSRHDGAGVHGNALCSDGKWHWSLRQWRTV
jgi:hypothetical protein